MAWWGAAAFGREVCIMQGGCKQAKLVARLRTADGKDITVPRERWNVGRAVVYTLTVAHDHTF